MKKVLIIVILVSLILISGCATQKVTIKQGIYGYTFSKSMGCTDSCKIKLLSMKIVVREPIELGHNLETKDLTGCFVENNGKLIKEVISNEKGFYELELPEGEYSLFFKTEYLGERECYISQIKQFDKEKNKQCTQNLNSLDEECIQKCPATDITPYSPCQKVCEVERLFTMNDCRARSTTARISIKSNQILNINQSLPDSFIK